MATIKHFEELEIWKQAKSLDKQLIPVFEKLKSESDFRTAGRIKAAAGL